MDRRRRDAAIPPGGFIDFGLSLRIPDTPGEKLTFKALQTYSGGEVVRWIGAEDSDNPAPIVTVTEAAGGEHGADHAAETATPVVAERTSATTEDDGGNGLAIIALIVGALGLAVGVAGFARASGRSA
jgi:hypothetical protein